jgi:hypothetical protein
MTKLYTAAEARRIDIERGGEGRITARGSTYKFNEIMLFWECYHHSSDEWIPSNYTSYDLSNDEWLPLTPEPEKNDFYLQNALNCVKSEQEKVAKLEAELAELKEKGRWKECWLEAPSTKFSVILRDDQENIVGRGAKLDNPDGYALYLGEARLLLNKESMRNWQWKYEEDL